VRAPGSGLGEGVGCGDRGAGRRGDVTKTADTLSQERFDREIACHSP
jgi:hypothetical protein